MGKEEPLRETTMTLPIPKLGGTLEEQPPAPPQEPHQAKNKEASTFIDMSFALSTSHTSCHHKAYVEKYLCHIGTDYGSLLIFTIIRICIGIARIAIIQESPSPE